LDHGLANRRRVLFEFGDHGGIVKDSTGDLAVSSSQSQNQMQGGFLLDVVITQRASVLQLLAGKNETLLIGWDSLLVLNLGLDIIDRIGGFDVQGNGLAGKSLDKNLNE